MIAGVIVSWNTRKLDRPFDYLVPSGLTEKIQIGSRVIVPFGKKSLKTEGFVIYLSDEKSDKKLKSIISIEENTCIDEKGVELASYLRDTTLCTYNEALSVMVPASSSVKFETWVRLDDEADTFVFTPIQQKIYDALRKNGGSCELVRLMSFFEENVRSHISAMEKKGAVRLEQTDSKSIKEKTLRFAALAVGSESLYEVEEELSKKAPRQHRIIKLLQRNEKVALCDLTFLCSASYNAVAALVKKGYVRLFDEVIRRNPIPEDIKRDTPMELTEEQRAVFERVSKSIHSEENEKFLLRGVTGSGKTEVYMQLIAEAVKDGKSAIVLVPEISLTPLIMKRFIMRFGNTVAILHSALSLGERYDEWQRIKSGEAKIVVGARSAVFAPCDNIGIIILDEEHEATYKSETAPHYHARSVAAFRAQQNSCPVLYASATPAIDSYYKAKQGKYVLLEMTKRYNNARLPYVYTVDMREELKSGNRSMFSSMLANELLYNMSHKEQSILFLNRRGFSTFVSCRECGFVAMCPHCNVSLTYHRNSSKLQCHYCGYTHENYSVCPSCGSKYIKFFGAGTQRLEEELKKQFEGISVVRMDIDTTQTKSSHEKLLNKFENEKCDVLLGTQMISKGLDYKNVTLVGVAAADTSLYTDDFRGNERTFDLITQVAGRAGRGDKEGRAIVQTYNPDNIAVRYAKKHDYVGFYNEEIRMRQAVWYPPFCDIVTLVVMGRNEGAVSARMKEIAKMLHFRLDGGKCGRILLLGPSPCQISKIKDKFRYRIIIKCEDAERLNDALRDIIDSQADHPNKNSLSLIIDKNPNNLS